MNNLTKRSLSGVVFVGILLTSILASWWTWGIILILLLFGIHLEICKLLKGIGYNISFTINLLSTILLFAGSYSIFILGEIHPIALIIMGSSIVFNTLIHAIREHKFTSALVITISTIYIAIPLGMSTGLLWSSYNSPVTNGFTLFPILYNPFLLFGLFILIWTFDSFAYLSGSLLGKHKILPKVSPKKSWEGFIGGLIFSCVAAFILSRLLGKLTFPQWGGLAIIVAFFGTIGDFAESQLKRMAKVKDSGNIIPGHGGLLDRFDSFLMIVPFALTYIVLLASF